MFDFYQDRYQLKKLLYSKEWPKAIEDDLLHQNIVERANTILYLLIGPDLLPDISSLLDFGCGDTAVIDAAAECGIKKAIAYDICPGQSIITNFEEVKSQGPFDAIIANDVLDHLQHDTVEEAIGKMISVLAPGGHIFLRCHPYTSRAGTHLPSHGLNKAYAHFFFPELVGEHTLKFPHPLFAYQEAFDKHSLIVEYRLHCRQKVEEFFTENEQLFKVFKDFTETEECYPIRIQNVEYVLRAVLPTDLSKDSSIGSPQKSSSEP